MTDISKSTTSKRKQTEITSKYEKTSSNINDHDTESKQSMKSLDSTYLA